MLKKPLSAPRPSDHTYKVLLHSSIIYRMLSLVIQAGGKSERMGEDKALKPFLGRPLIQRVIERLDALADEIIITTNRLDAYAFLLDWHRSRPWAGRGAQEPPPLRLVSDLEPGRGALGGLYTALASATRPIAAVVACDMPFASAALLEAAAQLLVQEEADVVIPRSAEGYEPFHAVYRCSRCVPAIRNALQANQWKVISWFPAVRVRELTPAEVAGLDPDGRAFWNVNTSEEFAAAERLATKLS